MPCGSTSACCRIWPSRSTASAASSDSTAPGVDVGELLADAGIEPERCLENFRAAKTERRAKLSAVELHRIAQGLIDVAAADGRIAENEVVRLYKLGEVLGVGPAACDLLVAEYLKDKRG